jgi:Zn-dependent M28 family amino/carboxypeptidase
MKVVSDISADNILANIVELSDLRTRHSESAEALVAEALLASKLIQLGFEVQTFNFREGFSGNVIATIPGTKYPDEFVIAGAHYDSRGSSSADPTSRAPGADDNGSGSAHLLEVARAISESKVAFEYTVLLCWFSGEEQGLVGSRAYAKHLADTNQMVVAMFNADMLGWKLPGTSVTVGMKDRFVADWLLTIANSLAEQYVPELIVGESASCCSDHQSFTENGFPAIGYFENEGSASDYPHYHKSSDLPECGARFPTEIYTRGCHWFPRLLA